MVLSVADIDRWNADDVREVFHAAKLRATATHEAADGLSGLPAFANWDGKAAEAAHDAVGRTRVDLDAHGDDAAAVARAADKAADDIEAVKHRLANLRAEADHLGMEIDPVTSTVLPGPGIKNPMEVLLKTEQLQSELTAILTDANAVDAELATAINMADGKTPIPSGGAPDGQPVTKQNGSAGQPGEPGQQPGTPGSPSSDFLRQLRNQMSQPGSGATTAASAPKGALDPTSPEGKAAADQMRKLLQEQGLPPQQIDARIADVFRRAQEPLPAPPKPEPAVKPPAPSIGERLGDAFNDFTNEVHEGFYDRLDQTVNTFENLTGTGGQGHPGVVDSWQQLVEGNAKHALTDPLSTLGPANPFGAVGTAAHELPEAINNPGHYVGEKLFDGTAAAATAPLGGEGALGRAMLPELRAVEHGALPDVGAVTHDVTPGIPHNVVDVPPVVDHGLATTGQHTSLSDMMLGGHSGDLSTDHLPPPFHFDPAVDPGYTSGSPYHPGDWPPHTPEPTWTNGSNDPGWEHINRGPEKPWMDYQSQIAGVERTPEGLIPEYTHVNPDTGAPVNFDGHTYRGDQEIFLDAKDGYGALATDVGKPWANGMADGLLREIPRQLDALPDGAILEIHVSDPVGAQAISGLLARNGLDEVLVIYTPKAP